MNEQCQDTVGHRGQGDFIQHCFYCGRLSLLFSWQNWLLGRQKLTSKRRFIGENTFYTLKEIITAHLNVLLQCKILKSTKMQSDFSFMNCFSPLYTLPPRFDWFIPIDFYFLLQALQFNSSPSRYKMFFPPLVNSCWCLLQDGLWHCVKTYFCFWLDWTFMALSL